MAAPPVHLPSCSSYSYTLFSSPFVNLEWSSSLNAVNKHHFHFQLNGKFSRSSSAVGGSNLRRISALHVRAATVENQDVKWWEKSGGPNMYDIHSTKEFLDALSQAGDKLVIAEFYGTWCGSCRALYPKLCKLAAEFPDIIFLKVNFDENKPMCKSLNIKVLPYFHFYRGAEGRIESFSCSLVKVDQQLLLELDEEGKMLLRLKAILEEHSRKREVKGLPIKLKNLLEEDAYWEINVILKDFP